MGICNVCHKHFRGEAYRCPECVKKKSIQDKIKKAMWIEQGLCSNCGSPREDERFKMCQRCRDNNKKKDVKKRRYQKGLKNFATSDRLTRILKDILKDKIDKPLRIEICHEYQTKLELAGLKNSADW